MNALELQHVTKSFSDFSLDHLTLTLPGGCIMGLVGQNGAGKTTTIKLILDMLQLDGGYISVLGMDITSTPARSRRMSAWCWMRWGFPHA